MAVQPSSGLFHRDILEGDPRRRFIPEGASIPRKPVASQSVIGSNAVTSVRDSIPERSHSSLRLRGFELLLLDGTDDEDRSTSWKPPGLPALVESDIRHAQGEVTHPGGQTDALLPQPPNGAVQHVSAASRYNWLPYSLKWPYLLALVLTSFALSATVSVLTWYSIVNRGLGSDTTSTVLLFGWRFSPTLVAVLYVLLETTLLTDVRRTEVFAKLARQKASSASSTILHPGRSWWDDPRDALRKRETVVAAVGHYFGLLLRTSSECLSSHRSRQVCYRQRTYRLPRLRLSIKLPLSTRARWWLLRMMQPTCNP